MVPNKYVNDKVQVKSSASPSTILYQCIYFIYCCYAIVQGLRDTQFYTCAQSNVLLKKLYKDKQL